MLTHITAQDCIRERWRNDQGWTREILREPATDAFHWRASIADIGHDTLYSPYNGYHRAQILLHGAGLELSFADAPKLRLDPGQPCLEFDGSALAHCHLLDGPVQVFNAIWDRQRIHLRPLLRPLVGPMVFLPEAGVRWLIHLISGEARLRAGQSTRLAPGDSLLLAVPEGTRWILDGAGYTLLLRLSEINALPHPPECI